MFVLLTSTNPRSLYFSEYEFLTAVLVDTELQGNYFFWGVTPSAQTAQLPLSLPPMLSFSKFCQPILVQT